MKAVVTSGGPEYRRPARLPVSLDGEWHDLIKELRRRGDLLKPDVALVELYLMALHEARECFRIIQCEGRTDMDRRVHPLCATFTANVKIAGVIAAKLGIGQAARHRLPREPFRVRYGTPADDGQIDVLDRLGV